MLLGLPSELLVKHSIFLTIHSVLIAASERSVRPVINNTPLSAIFRHLAFRMIDTHHPALMHILVNLGQVLELLEYEFAFDFAQRGELDG